jgi:hypothetical protein
VSDLAIAEIEKFYQMGIATDVDKNFFDQALHQYKSNTSLSVASVEKTFKQHIIDNESRYHLDQAGNFVKLWPELEFLCQ